jgi:hypothetical protein
VDNKTAVDKDLVNNSYVCYYLGIKKAPCGGAFCLKG